MIETYGELLLAQADGVQVGQQGAVTGRAVQGEGECPRVRHREWGADADSDCAEKAGQQVIQINISSSFRSARFQKKFKDGACRRLMRALEGRRTHAFRPGALRGYIKRAEPPYHLRHVGLGCRPWALPVLGL